MLINTKLHSCINKSLLVLLCILQAKQPKQNESYSQQFVLLCIMKASSYRPVIPVGQCRYFILKHLLTDANDVQRMVCIPHYSCLHNVNFNVCFGGIFFFFLSIQHSSGILRMFERQTCSGAPVNRKSTGRATSRSLYHVLSTPGAVKRAISPAVQQCSIASSFSVSIEYKCTSQAPLISRSYTHETRDTIVFATV